MSGFDEPWKQSWAREADKAKELSEHNRRLRAALVKAEEEVAALDHARGNQEDYLGELERERDHAKHMHMMADQSAVDAWAWGKKMERQRDENADIIATWRQRAEEAEECIVWVKCDDPEHERLAAAESRAEQMERVVEAARTVELAWAGWIFPNHAEPHLLEGVDDAVFALTDALAALPSPESEQ
jgi:hypothetical protein